LALLSGVRLDLSRLLMSNLRSWDATMAAAAVALAPGLLVLSTGVIGRSHKRLTGLTDLSTGAPEANQLPCRWG
jgi:hypothetical protein